MPIKILCLSENESRYRDEFMKYWMNKEGINYESSDTQGGFCLNLIKKNEQMFHVFTLSCQSFFKKVKIHNIFYPGTHAFIYILSLSEALQPGRLKSFSKEAGRYTSYAKKILVIFDNVQAKTLVDKEMLISMPEEDDENIHKNIHDNKENFSEKSTEFSEKSTMDFAESSSANLKLFYEIKDYNQNYLKLEEEAKNAGFESILFFSPTLFVDRIWLSLASTAQILHIQESAINKQLYQKINHLLDNLFFLRQSLFFQEDDSQFKQLEIVEYLLKHIVLTYKEGNEDFLESSLCAEKKIKQFLDQYSPEPNFFKSFFTLFFTRQQEKKFKEPRQWKPVYDLLRSLQATLKLLRENLKQDLKKEAYSNNRFI